MDTQNKHTQDLGRGNVGKLLFQLSIPAIIAQIVNVLYNIVDRIFLGRMVSGDLAMAGVGIAFPVIVTISAFSSLIGMGGAPLAAIKMGEKNNDGAEQIMTNCFAMLLCVSVLLTTLIFIFQEPILWAFGASEATIDYALDYLTIYLIGTIAVQIAIGMNTFITTQGFAKTAMFSVMIGAGINILLDPLFIFGFNMGVRGAALATIIAQFASAIWVMCFLLGNKGKLKLQKKYFTLNPKISGRVLALGISPFVMQVTQALVVIVMNSSMLKYSGDIGVSMMTVMSSVMQIATLPITGLCQGGQPIISYNYGAKKYDRVKKTFRLLLISCVGYTTFMWLITLFMPEMLVRIFNNEAHLIELGKLCIPIYFGGIFMFGIQMSCQQTFLALGKAKISVILALVRKVVLLVPMAFILPMFFTTNEGKMIGALLSEPVADVGAAIVTGIAFALFYKNVLQKQM